MGLLNAWNESFATTSLDLVGYADRWWLIQASRKCDCGYMEVEGPIRAMSLFYMNNDDVWIRHGNLFSVVVGNR